MLTRLIRSADRVCPKNLKGPLIKPIFIEQRKFSINQIILPIIRRTDGREDSTLKPSRKKLNQGIVQMFDLVEDAKNLLDDSLACNPFGNQPDGQPEHCKSAVEFFIENLGRIGSGSHGS